MKRLKILSVVFIFVILLMPSDTSAKESLGVCNYDIDVEKLFLQNSISDLQLTVTIYDDGSTGKRKFKGHDSFGNEINVTPSSGAVLDGSGTRLSYSKMFDKNGRFYQAYEERKNCPPIQFIYTNPVLEFHLNGGAYVPQGSGSDVITPEITGGSSSSTSRPSVTYCTKNSRLDFGDVDITFTPKEQNGVKEYTITVGGTSTTARYNEVSRVGDYTFQVREEDYEVYWSNQCDEAAFHLAGDPSYGDTLTIQTVLPDDGNNASSDYDGNDSWDQIDGVEIGTGDIRCETIFTDDPGSIGWLLQTILNYIKVIGPILVVILSAIDFIKAITSSDDKAMKEAQSKLIIRLIAALALFLIPTLVQVLLSFISDSICMPIS